MFKPKVVLKDNYCEPAPRVYTATVDYHEPTECAPCCDDSVYVRGARGLSAYEIAVKNGFVGTEVQWLAAMGGATPPERIPFTNATGAVIVDYSINNRRILYADPSYEVYLTSGSVDTSIGGYGVTITRVVGIIDNITFDGLFGTGYIVLKA